MLRMVMSGFITHSHYKLRCIIFTYALVLTKELKAIYGSCLICSHGSPEGRREGVGLILSENKETGRNFQAFSDIRKDSSKDNEGHPFLLYQHFELVILGPSCENGNLLDDNPHSGARVLLLSS